MLSPDLADLARLGRLKTEKQSNNKKTKLAVLSLEGDASTIEVRAVAVAAYVVPLACQSISVSVAS